MANNKKYWATPKTHYIPASDYPRVQRAAKEGTEKHMDSRFRFNMCILHNNLDDSIKNFHVFPVPPSMCQFIPLYFVNLEISCTMRVV